MPAIVLNSIAVSEVIFFILNSSLWLQSIIVVCKCEGARVCERLRQKMCVNTGVCEIATDFACSCDLLACTAKNILTLIVWLLFDHL